MKKTVLTAGFFFMLLLVCIHVNAQEFQQDWVKKFVGTGLDKAAGIAADNAGHVWICGNNNWGTTPEMYTVRYDASGLQSAGFLYNPENQFTEGGAIAIDPAGNVYVAGRVLVDASTSNIVVIKYSSSAIQQWVTIFNTPQNYAENVTAMTVDASGNIYIAGTVVKEEPFSYDYLTLKLNTDGVVQWHRTYNGTADGLDFGNDIAVDRSGNVYITGGSQGEVKKRSLSIPTGLDFVTIKYTSTGSQQWVNRYRKSSKNDEARALALDTAGNIFVTGTATSTSASDIDGLTIKLRNNGNIEWIQSYAGPGGGSDFLSDVVVDRAGNAYVSGYVTNTNNDRDILAIKYNTSGAQQWVSTYGIEAGTNEEGVKMGIDIFGDIYVTGKTNVPGVVNSDFLTTKFTTAGNNVWAARYNGPEDNTDEATSMVVVEDPNSPAFQLADIYVFGTSASDVITIKYSQPIIIGDLSMVETLPLNYSISNYPNPFTSTTNINYQIPEPGRVMINVYDAIGRKISTLVDANHNAGAFVKRFDASGLPGGIYHYQIVINANGKEFRKTKSMVLQK
jgi:hypothetical protein